MTGLFLPLFFGVPILAAALAAAAPWVAVRRLLLHGVTLASLAGAVALLVGHASTPVVAAQVGGFVPGVAIPFVSDTFSAVMLVLTGFVTAVSLLHCELTGEVTRARLFPSLALLLLAGVNGALLTGDLFNLFVCVEVMLMPSYALVAMTGTWRRLGVGRLFVVVNLLTSTVLLAGVGLVYAVTGRVNLASLAGLAREDGRVAAAAGLVLVALCIKAGSVPVHGWLPLAYPATSPGVMALFSGVHTKVAVYAVVRIWATVFDLDPRWAWLLLAAALTSTAWGAVASAHPRLVREVLAWQMVSGVGVILSALALAGLAPGDGMVRPLTAAGLAGAIVYTAHHMLTMGSLITVLGAAEHTYGTGRLDRLSGLWRRDRALAVLLVVGIASLVGLPPTSGLVAKLEVVTAAVVAGGVPGLTTLAVVLVSSAVGLVAMTRLWRSVMWGDPMRAGAAADPAVRVPNRLLLPGGLLAAASVALFLGYGAGAPVVDRAVDGLLDTDAYVSTVLPVAPPGGAR